MRPFKKNWKCDLDSAWNEIEVGHLFFLNKLLGSLRTNNSKETLNSGKRFLNAQGKEV